jgi:hypothetical protein
MHPVSPFPFAARVVLAGALGLVVPLSAGASQGSPDDWQFAATLYGWFPSINGSVTYKNAPVGRLAGVSGGSADISVGTDQLLDALNSVFMGALEVRRGPWGAFTDVIYMDLNADKNKDLRTAIPGASALTANLDLGLSATVWTLAGQYQVVDNPTASANVLLGARYVEMDLGLDIAVSAPVVGQVPVANVSANPSVWDGIIGVKGEFKPGGNWFVPYYADVGTGGSKLTWQALLGAGYRFNWGDLVLAYRYLDYQFDNNDKADVNLAFGGVALGVTFRF